jgi:hypothetical protein
MQSSSRTKHCTKSCGSKFRRRAGTLCCVNDPRSDTPRHLLCSASSALAELRHRVSQSSGAPSAHHQPTQQGIGRADNGSNGALQSNLPSQDRQNLSRITSARAFKEPDAAAVQPSSGMAGKAKAKAGFLGKHSHRIQDRHPKGTCASQITTGLCLLHRPLGCRKRDFAAGVPAG